MSGIVYAKENAWLTDSVGMGYTVQANSPWDADDPLVKRHPGFFQREPVVVMRTVPLVEQATRSPGEVRPSRVR